MSATQTPSPIATQTPQAAMTPRRATPPEQSSTPFTTSTPTSSASALPTASQRRGRLLVPSATPPPRTTPFATPRPAIQSSSTPTDTISSTPIPAPSASPTAAGGGLQQEMTRGKFKSQAQKFQPRQIEPTPSASPSGTVTSIPSPNTASAPASSAVEKLTKQEK